MHNEDIVPATLPTWTLDLTGQPWGSATRGALFLEEIQPFLIYVHFAKGRTGRGIPHRRADQAEITWHRHVRKLPYDFS
jgi:hypothetical protein